MPFWPGGMDDITNDVPDLDGLVKGEKGLRTIPPGFTRGLRLPGDEVDDETVAVLDGFQANPKPLGAVSRPLFLHIMGLILTSPNIRAALRRVIHL